MKVIMLSLLLILGGTTQVWAKTDWNTSFFAGYSAASLRSLNDSKLQKSTFIPPTVGGSPAIRGGPLVGVEIEWEIRPRLTLVAMASFWEGESRSIESGEAVFEDIGFRSFQVNRTIRLSFNEYALRTRYHLIESKDLGRFYLEIGFFNQVRVTFLEDSSYEFDVDGEKFLRNILSKAESNGGYLFEWGLGGDYFLTQWLSLHLNANYRTGEAVSLEYTSYEHTFLGQDGITAASGFSPFPSEGDPVTFVENNVRIPLKLELDGWQVSFGIRIYF